MRTAHAHMHKLRKLKPQYVYNCEMYILSFFVHLYY